MHPLRPHGFYTLSPTPHSYIHLLRFNLVIRKIIYSGRARAAKLPQLSQEELIYTSLSQVFFIYALTLILIYSWAEYGGVVFEPITKAIYAGAAIFFFVLSYLAFERVKTVDFFDFVAGMIFTGELRKYPYGKAVDLGAAQLYFGLVLVAVAPVLAKSSDPSVSAGVLTLGGLLIATGVVMYVLSGTKLRQ